jgi:hypothetical protein
MCFVSVYENRRMKSVEIVLRRRGGGKKEYDGGVNSTKIHFKHICNYHNVSPIQILYANKNHNIKGRKKILLSCEIV